ncbi:MAG: MBL fold metallo-hydrolase [Actinomycetia bacterium]|nr:MBL fold metallo-hydrolase [Actinomycetes bacterium]
MKLSIGSTTITSIVEQDLTFLSEVVPNARPSDLAGLPWLKPHFVDADNGMLGLVQSFLIEHGGARIVVDTCVGNGKENFSIPEWAHMNSDFLQRFAEAGFQPASVDYVVCTHMHMDHVGWNTYLHEGHWKPTFPNARHIFVSDELRYWTSEIAKPVSGQGGLTGESDEYKTAFQQTQAAIYEQSVKPILDAGLALFVDSSHTLMPGVKLVATPGHTPAHVSVEIDADGRKALISGDSFHHPCQIAHPEWAADPDTDQDASTQTRRNILAELADSATYFIGTHFAEPVAGKIVTDGQSYRFDTVVTR